MPPLFTGMTFNWGDWSINNLLRHLKIGSYFTITVQVNRYPRLFVVSPSHVPTFLSISKRKGNGNWKKSLHKKLSWFKTQVTPVSTQMHKGTLNQELAELLNMNRRFFTYRSEIASGIKLNCKIWVGIYFLSRFMQICAVMHVWALVKQPIENHSIC